jgi:hypothetical protein
MIEAGDQRIIEAIRHAVVAGSCRTWATKEIQAAAGLTRAADRHSALAGARLDEWLSAETSFPGGLRTRMSAPIGGGSGADMS